MESTKAWYKSRTIWASLIAAGGALTSMAGFPVEAFDQASLADLLVQSVTAISGIVAILGRLFATTRIG